MVKVFFNNSCNICRAEINHYKKHSDNSVEWIDVTNNEEAQKITSKSYKELLRRMHVIKDGKVIDGAESFLIIWKTINETINTNTTTEIVPRNCAPKVTSPFVNGTANVPHTPATK